MALESESCVGVGHSRAIVDNLYKGAAAVFEDYLYRGGTRVDCVFDEFFDYRSRALDNFAGCYLVCHRVGQ